MKKIFCIFVAVLITIVPLTVHTFAYSFDLQNRELNCKNAIVMDTDSGRIIFSKNADSKVAMASLTKIMTAVIVLENCENLNEKLTVTEKDLEPIKNQDLVVANLEPGEEISVKDLLMCLLVPSAADAAMVLASHFGSNVEKFVFMMNAKAKLLNLKNTHFINPHGMDEENHYSTAKDMAILTKYAYSVNGFANLVSQYTYTVPKTNKSEERVLETTNFLINPESEYYYKYAKGTKTGYTDNAGRCLITYAEKNNTRLICIILGCDIYDEEWKLSPKYFEDTIYLLEKMFSEYSNKIIYKKSETVKIVKAKSFGISGKTNAVPEENIYYISGKNENIEKIVTLKNEKIKGSVKKGENLGKVILKLNNENIGEYNLVASNDVKFSFIRALFDLICYILVILIIILVIMRIRVVIIKKKKKKHK